jgi:peptidoglycan-N-acetylglucosamine deacetylase
MTKYGDKGGGSGGGVTRRVLLVAGGGLTLGALYAAGSRAGGSDAGGPASLTGARAERGAGIPPGGARGPGGSGTGQPASPHPAGTTPATAAAHPAAAHPGTSRRRPGGDGKSGPGGKGAPAEKPMWYVDDGPKVIALTIDDGPSPVYTPQILAILARNKVTAAFSMVGENVRYYPGVAREVAAAGHMIVNHTWDHADLSRLSAAGTRREIDRATAEIHAATGVAPRMFRAPYGTWTPAALDYCARERLTPLDWSVDPRDWSRPGAGAIVNTIMATIRTGSIILEHDGGGDRSQTVAALESVIPRLLSEGYRFTVP